MPKLPRWGVAASMGADTKANASARGGALEVGDLRLVEDGCECNGALVSNVVVKDTVSEGQDGTVRR